MELGYDRLDPDPALNKNWIRIRNSVQAGHGEREAGEPEGHEGGRRHVLHLKGDYPILSVGKDVSPSVRTPAIMASTLQIQLFT